ncbi:macro domain-containing protein [Streptomyces sp. NPDC020480]|uniref:macro domain-containing protein n=1 Tax=Streptomyces sp. NPDC020480 TaxID=3365076 RepID=UPI003793FEE5
MSVGHNFGQLFSTRRGLALLTRNALGVFGLLSGALQIALALWASIRLSVPQRWGLLAFLLGASLAFGIFRAWPRRVVIREFDNPDICVTVRVGDLFDQQTHLVVGFTDTFDTDTTNNLVISRNSVQGQFQERIYGNDVVRLDAELESALTGVTPICSEDRAEKQNGKLLRYPVGTVATLGDPARYFFCAAYSHMQNNLIAQSDVNSLWKSLDAVWEAVYIHAQRKAVSISIVGSELARISCLNRESLLKMIALSFVARSRQSPVCKELRILIHPKDYQHINMLEVDAFLRTL